MGPPLRLFLLVLALGVAVAALLRPATVIPAPIQAFAAPSDASRGQSLTFAGVAEGDQRVILGAVAATTPEARRLVEAVAGLVTMRVGPAGPTTAGTTRPTPTGYDVTLDLGLVNQTLGRRGMDRLVLHELGHVVQFALVPAATLTALDAGIPRGYGCEAGQLGACAGPEERFAESFAKWATGDIGVDLFIGYKVPPPAGPIDTWAEPLTRLGR